MSDQDIVEEDSSSSTESALDAARSDEENGGGDDSGASGGGSRGKPAKEVSLTDPQAAWVARKGVDPFFAYDANYLIDNKTGIITILTYDPVTRRMIPRASRPISDAFNQR